MKSSMRKYKKRKDAASAADIMKISRSVFLFLLSSLCLFILAYAQDKEILFREDFNDLENWKPLYFPKIKKHTVYTVEKNDGESFLKAASEASASAIVWKKEFNVYEYPLAGWRWKVEDLYKRADPHRKYGDDYPIRIYVLFKYDPERASFFGKVKFGMMKKIYGEYPPDSTLNYVWASTENIERIFSSPYTDRSRIVVLEKGAKNAGMWMTEEANILEDYMEAFGRKPPATASLAIMNDSDDTGESSVSYVDFLEIYRTLKHIP